MPNAPVDTTTNRLNLNESPCFDIREVILIGDEAKKFIPLLKTTLKQVNFKPNLCLGAKSINAITTSFNNAIIAKGYIILPTQNIKDDILKLQLTAGKINNLSINDTNSTSKFMAFGGSKKDEILTLIDLE